MTLDADGLSRLKVKDLQRELKKRGLDTSGLKAVLLQRLTDSLEQEVDTKVEEQEDMEEDETVEKKEEEKNSEKDENGVEKRVTEKETPVDSDDKPMEEPENAAKEKKEESDGVDEDKPEPAAGPKRGVDEVDTKEDESERYAKKPKLEEDASNSKKEDNDTTAATGLKRGADEVNTAENEGERDVKKPKLEEEVENGKNEDDGKAFVLDEANDEKAGDEDAEATEDEPKKTLRIDNFVRPFTLNAVKALVQELGDFVEDGFWMDTIKTHCYVTYNSVEIAEKTSAALDGKVWPPENGRSLRVKIMDHTAMEVSQYGEAHLPNRPKSKGSNGAPATQRQKVTIDEFFHKTETKPVLYYLPLTDEQVKERKERQSQQREGQPRKRRHRGGRKRNRRGRFQRR